METFSRVLVDSNFIIALFNPDDGLFKAADLALTKLLLSRSVLVVTNFVFSEVVTVLSQRRGRIVASEAGEHILEDSSFEFLYLDEYLHHETWEIFRQINRKNVGFVDCSMLAVMRLENCDAFLTFDHALAKLAEKQRFKLWPTT